MLNAVSSSVEALKQKVSMLETTLATKADMTHIQEVIKRSEVIKKITDSKSVGMDSKVGISLDGRVVAESVVEHKTDGIKMTAINIKGVRANETN
ncbi:hypothetical protein [Bacillus mycoides]|uniref:hypothetical protein n=1 Tax=Bacillus mycoides TaxID=1405 RepID=UPI00292FC17C|nr:hypothetical protein [Bacillus mycoides]WOA61071.1 hypothetical protein RVY74_31950 [Bacillus mycoides]